MRVRAKTPSLRTGFTATLPGSVDARRSNAPSRRPAFVVAVLMVLLAALTFAGSANAAKTRAYTGVSFGPDGPGGTETFSNLQSIAVNQADGSIYALNMARFISDKGAIYKFDSAGTPSDFSALGSNHIDGITGTAENAESQIAVAPAGSPGGTAGFIYIANNTASVAVFDPSGEEAGELELAGEEICGVATNSAGHVFVGSYPSTIREYTPSAGLITAADKTGESTGVVSELCNVAADALGNIYGASYNREILGRLDGIEDSEATAIEPAGAPIAIDPTTNSLYADRGNEVAVYGSNGEAELEFGSGQLTDSFGVAVDSSTGQAYVADGGSGTIKVFGGPLTFPTTEAATAVTTEAATLHGTVYPEERHYTACRFKYGLVSASGFEHEAECEPGAAQIPASSSPQAVSLSLDGLQPNSDYKFRLTATNSAGSGEGETLTFSTVGPPRITEILSRADQGSATLEATVDPRGAETSYRIESGPRESYGDVVATGSIAPGDGPTRVTAHLADLTPDTVYHYRVVANSTEAGESASSDQQVETLNACGFTDDRCIELVSRADKGPIASPGKQFTIGAQIQFQAASVGSALAYTTVSGYPEATVGDATMYLARRSSSGWLSEQISPPTLEPPGKSGNNSAFKVLSSNLGCGIVASFSPLAAGAPEAVVENGGSNLFLRDDATGAYQTITDLPPAGPPGWEEELTNFDYQIIGMSPDCRRVVFRTGYRYPGIPAVSASKSQLYEWDDGVLHNVAIIPGTGGSGEPVPAESIPGAMKEHPESSAPLGEAAPTDFWRSVSDDGSRSIFTASSHFGGDSGELAIFLRDTTDSGEMDGTVPATDISQSETAVPNNGNSRYWTASTDAKRIFFTARYGLATDGSSTGLTSCANGPFEETGSGCDLYEYDVDAPVGERLSDLSPDSSDPGGAGVAGVLDASGDGSYVYFAARGRLGGAGKTEADNLEGLTYNLYVAHAGVIHLVGFLGEKSTIGNGRAARALIANGGNIWTSASTTDGKKFVFESSVGVPGGVSMVYLYSAADGTSVCVSCRGDGEPPFSEHRLTALLYPAQMNESDQTQRPFVLTDNGRLYFYSFDALAPGGVEGDQNLYQWEHGQVSPIAVEPSGVPRGAAGEPVAAFFAGASADGEDVFFATPQVLTGGATEGWNIYDARADGGFPEPPPPTPPCDAVVEGACSSGQAAPTAPAAPATLTFVGPSNPPAKKKHKPQKRNNKKKHHKKAGKAGRGNGDRRAGK